jgi:hypothetical protein
MTLVSLTRIPVSRWAPRGGSTVPVPAAPTSSAAVPSGATVIGVPIPVVVPAGRRRAAAAPAGRSPAIVVATVSDSSAATAAAIVVVIGTATAAIAAPAARAFVIIIASAAAVLGTVRDRGRPTAVIAAIEPADAVGRIGRRRSPAIGGVAARRHPITILAAAVTVVEPVPAYSSRRVLITRASAPAASFVGTLAGNVLDCEDGLVELPPVGGVLGPGSLVDRTELYKGVVALHVDSANFSVRLEKHLEVRSAGGALVEVHHEQRVGRLDDLAALVLLAFDSAIPPRELGPEGGRYILDPPGESTRRAIRVI